jgi:hypothetical protein
MRRAAKPDGLVSSHFESDRKERLTHSGLELRRDEVEDLVQRNDLVGKSAVVDEDLTGAVLHWGGRKAGELKLIIELVEGRTLSNVDGELEIWTGGFEPNTDLRADLGKEVLTGLTRERGNEKGNLLVKHLTERCVRERDAEAGAVGGNSSIQGGGEGRKKEKAHMMSPDDPGEREREASHPKAENTSLMKVETCTGMQKSINWWKGGKRKTTNAINDVFRKDNQPSHGLQ